jgi:CRP-like cAMP-binding protein
MIYEPDDRGEAVFLLQHGRVERYHVARDGRRLVVETLRAPAMFGELGLVVTGRYGCYAAAAEDCLLRVVQSLDVRALVQRNPGLGLRLLAHLGRHCHSCEAELAKLTFQGLAARLAALLLREADEAGAVTAHSHQELAERLGT